MITTAQFGLKSVLLLMMSATSSMGSRVNSSTSPSCAARTISVGFSKTPGRGTLDREYIHAMQRAAAEGSSTASGSQGRLPWIRLQPAAWVGGFQMADDLSCRLEVRRQLQVVAEENVPLEAIGRDGLVADGADRPEVGRRGVCQSNKIALPPP